MHLGLIRRCKPFVGGLLRACGYRVLEALQVFADGVGHGYVDVFLRVVPIDGNSAVLSSIQVDGDRLILPYLIEEVGGVVGGEEFDSKVIYSKVEGGR